MKILAIDSTAIVASVALCDDDKLIAIYSAKTGHPVHINSVVDPTVIGGMRIQVGDEVTDNTVVAQLQHLQRTVKATA